MKEKDKRRDARGESRERAKCQRETLGKYFYDLSKLTFTALVLGGALTFFQGYEFNATVIGMVVFGVAVSLVPTLPYRIIKELSTAYLQPTIANSKPEVSKINYSR